MRIKRNILWTMIALIVISCGTLGAEIRTYRQFRDVATKENGKVIESSDPHNLFEYTYSIDDKAKTITRTKIRRLDEATPRNDATVYRITEQKNVFGSEAGNGGQVLVAVPKNGSEILELSHRFAFTARTSPFSQVISGVYKRVYVNDRDRKHHRDKDKD